MFGLRFPRKGRFPQILSARECPLNMQNPLRFAFWRIGAPNPPLKRIRLLLLCFSSLPSPDRQAYLNAVLPNQNLYIFVWSSFDLLAQKDFRRRHILFLYNLCLCRLRLFSLYRQKFLFRGCHEQYSLQRANPDSFQYACTFYFYIFAFL
ncbi:hypothetical protein SDC9_178600 [bioreactor metagenome]|uniref:Uncharacterized protein n=1 Tax=bioreactor metagenome TaxID=1076179 RepID=A0A645GY04_9ZZZZ